MMFVQVAGGWPVGGGNGCGVGVDGGDRRRCERVHSGVGGGGSAPDPGGKGVRGRLCQWGVAGFELRRVDDLGGERDGPGVHASAVSGQWQQRGDQRHVAGVFNGFRVDADEGVRGARDVDRDGSDVQLAANEGRLLGTLSTLATNSYSTLTVPLTGDGTYAFVLTTTATSPRNMTSREMGTPPQLVLSSAPLISRPVRMIR